jgi:hypothetical protein
MSRLLTFFKGADTQLGVFYPKHYLLAIFPTLAAADGAKADLNRAGQGDDDIVSVSGDEVVQFAEDHLIKDGVWGVLMTEVSRLLGTEALYADEDLAMARNGAAFVAVHCPTEEVKTHMWKLLEHLHPLVARYYGVAGIEHLTGEN